MNVVAGTATLSALALAGVAVWGAAAKVRIDCRAHHAEARSLLERARATAEPRDYAAAGEACLRALRSWSPLDPEPGRAVDALLGITPRLEASEAARQLDAAVRDIDALALVYAPLVAERVELVAAREALTRRSLAPRPAPDGAPAPEPTGE